MIWPDCTLSNKLKSITPILKFEMNMVNDKNQKRNKKKKQKMKLKKKIKQKENNIENNEVYQFLKTRWDYYKNNSVICN